MEEQSETTKGENKSPLASIDIKGQRMIKSGKWSVINVY